MTPEQFLELLKTRSRKTLSTSRTQQYPRYANNFILDRDASGIIHVYTCEDFITGRHDQIRYSTDDIHDALNFTTGQRGPTIDCFNNTPIIKWLRFTLPIQHAWYRLTAFFRTPPHREIEFAGWLTPFTKNQVGNHPVFNFTRFPPAGYSFVRRAQGNKISYWKAIPFFYSIFTLSMRMLRNGVPYHFFVRFWATRGLGQEYLRLPAGTNKLVLYPSFSFLVPFHSWMIEIEDVTTLMYPFIPFGSPNPEFTRDHPIVKIMEIYLGDRRCKGIICHLEATANGLRTLFREKPKIVQKIQHIPLGWHLPSAIERTPGPKATINILFMNGWAQDPGAFFRRGGLAALDAFDKVSDEFDNIRLIIRSPLPPLPEKYQTILRKPNIVILSEKLNVTELEALYCESDILLFPAPRVAITTLFQAMSYSMAIVTSDGFGIEEYVKDNINGLVARGFLGQSGWFDMHGLFHEDYLTCLEYNPVLIDNLVGALRRLISDNDLRYRMQLASREYLETHFSMKQWNERLAPILERAFHTSTTPKPIKPISRHQERWSSKPIQSNESIDQLPHALTTDTNPNTPFDKKGDERVIDIEYAGWLPAFDKFGHCGTHPLFAHIDAPPDGYRFTLSSHTKSGLLESIKRVLQTGFGAYRLGIQARRGGSTLRDVFHFCKERGFREQLKLPSATRTLYLPSVPYTYGQHNWMIEIEDATTLFFPFVRNGQTIHSDVLEHPIYPIMKAMLESDRCKGIVTHMKSTAEALPVLFRSPTLANKVYHNPAGVPLPGPVNRSRPRRKLRMLFTNSWHQASGSFYVRGGLDTLEAYRQLRLQHPNVELVIRSQLPPDLASFYPDYARVVGDPSVQILDSRMDNISWRGLLESSDVLIIPSARIHVVSILEAMSYGLVVVTSDGWGITEYVEDGVNGIVVPGRYGKTSWIDHDGILRENYEPLNDAQAKSTPMRQVDDMVVAGIVGRVGELIEYPELRQEISRNARKAVETEFSLSHWNSRFKIILDDLMDRHK